MLYFLRCAALVTLCAIGWTVYLIWNFAPFIP